MSDCVEDYAEELNMFDSVAPKVARSGEDSIKEPTSEPGW